MEGQYANKEQLIEIIEETINNELTQDESILPNLINSFKKRCEK